MIDTQNVSSSIISLDECTLDLMAFIYQIQKIMRKVFLIYK